ncbi:MAG: tRNA pseudouridine55 synthase [Parcubacteria bacterium C7867-008]|nr:MAG: tRNA pseudouridine55 synthase [Parcubacteria bacterium C7867-008]
MQKYVVLNKKIGQTPLETIQAWKMSNPTYIDTPATYAGRLDPMASGLLLVLFGDECKKKDAYLGLDKEYEVEIVLDLSSDTGDVLGLISETDTYTTPSSVEVQASCAKEIGAHTLPYPSYSSKTVDGVPLFLHALRDTLNTIDIPTHTETIHSIKLKSVSTISSVDLHKRIKEILTAAPHSDEPSKELGADFRIHAVRNSWGTVFVKPERSFTVIHLRVVCGSGAYMRTLAERIGTSLGTHALALSIHRTSVGIYKKIGPLAFWTKNFKLP